MACAATYSPARMTASPGRKPRSRPHFLYGHAVLADGELLYVGQGGIVLSSKDGGRTLAIVQREGRANVTDIVIGGDGRWIRSSDGGRLRQPDQDRQGAV